MFSVWYSFPFVDEEERLGKMNTRAGDIEDKGDRSQLATSLMSSCECVTEAGRGAVSKGRKTAI